MFFTNEVKKTYWFQRKKSLLLSKTKKEVSYSNQIHLVYGFLIQVLCCGRFFFKYLGCSEQNKYKLVISYKINITTGNILLLRAQ